MRVYTRSAEGGLIVLEAYQDVVLPLMSNQKELRRNIIQEGGKPDKNFPIFASIKGGKK